MDDKRDKTGPLLLDRRRLLGRFALMGAAIPVAGGALVACYDEEDPPAGGAPQTTVTATTTATAAATDTAAPSATTTPTPTGEAPAADVTFTLVTTITGHGLSFVGKGGNIDGVENPLLEVPPASVVAIVLENGDGSEHDIAIDEFNAQSPRIRGVGETTTLTIQTDSEGDFAYFCTLPGHRIAGMEGTLRVGAGGSSATAPSIVRESTDLPGPLPQRGLETVQVELEAVELDGQLADGATYTYWTFNSKVPGPFLRVRVNDQVEVRLINRLDSSMTHSVDFHAATGPGGGGNVTQVPPGEERSFTFQPLNPGLYVYHCATPSVAHHISNGMYGLILVEPEGGLPPVDREFYVMQGEIYTEEAFGSKGKLNFSPQKLSNERPEYFFFNGAVGALSTQHPLEANVGETVRIFFGVGGPNYTSSFHVIGEVFDRVYVQASLTSEPLTNVQTTTVPPGGAAVVEFGLEVPGDYVLVDHALSRAERGLAGILKVAGPENPDVFREGIGG